MSVENVRDQHEYKDYIFKTFLEQKQNTFLKNLVFIPHTVP